ncbi:apolipoprotein N-acyltransferase [candidate division KSB1 bacterium]|nr:apolipoprotein N-acyltransferase [candidate division KSB1 bacterium]
MRRDLLLLLLTGIMLAFSFPPFKTGILAYTALIPFFLLLENKYGFEAFRWGYLTGLVFHSVTLYWIGWVTLPGLFGALLLLPLFVGFYALLHTFLLKNLKTAFFIPFLWVSIEYLQSLGDTAFPWNYIGYSQSYYHSLIQYADYSGIYGISFWVIVINVLLYNLCSNRCLPGLRKRILTAIILLLVLPAFYGMFVYQRYQSGEKICISLLQGNVDPLAKWQDNSNESNYNLYSGLSKQVTADKPDLIIWPETAIPFYLRFEGEYLTRIHNLVDSIQTPIITGALDYDYDEEGKSSYYNASFLIQPNKSRIEGYRKKRLVPFSERVPYRDYPPFNFLKNILYDMVLGVGDFTRGTDYTTFSFNNPIQNSKQDQLKIATPICYESVFPDLIRRFVKKNTDFIAIITNDAWFGKTAAPYQHAQIAVFRAIENRTAIARCANTGVSCFIDPLGRMQKSTSIFEKTSLTAELPKKTVTTFYTRYGDVFAQFVAAITLFLFIMAVYKCIDDRCKS